MQTVKNLVTAKKDVKIGNHRVEIINFENGKCLVRKFYYYSTVICKVDYSSRSFSIDSSYGSQSTTRACNAYRAYFKQIGYTEINVQTGEVI
jgi:hypothetical protein